MSENLVSVVITTHNQSKVLCNAIDSVLAQTWKNLEFILVDDASTDNTFEMIQQMYGHLDNLMYIANEEQVGASISRNIGVSYARGEYIAFLDADMLWGPDKLEKQMNQLLEQDSGKNAVYCSYAAVGKEDTTEFPPVDVPLECRGGNIYPYSLDRQLIDMSTLLLSKEVFERIGGFDSQLHALQEYEFSIRLAQYGLVDYIAQILVITYQDKEEQQKLVNPEEIITCCSIIEAHYDSLLTFGLLDKKLKSLYQNIPEQNRDMYFECLSLIERKEVQTFVQEERKALDTSNCPQQIAGNIAQVSECIGCMSCYASCDLGAIHPEYTKEGFMYPKIDDTLCVNCGKCIDVCPLCNTIKGTPNSKECYAVMASDEVRKKSSSGGIFFVLADYILKQNGYVAGAVFTEDFMVKHIVSNKREDIEKMLESKYLQSDTREIYPEIRQLLMGGELVLFSGCACQVAALRTFLGGKEYKNLLTVDVVCHGAPSPGVFRNFILEKPKISDISFRDKESLGWKAGLCVHYDNGEKTVEIDMENPYMYAFLNNWLLRDSCYDCHFKKQKYSDITLGDFWGINAYAQFDDGLGTSFVTVNTNKGVDLFLNTQSSWKDFATIQTIAAWRFNPCIDRPVGRTGFREAFFENYNKDSLEQSIRDTKKSMHFDIALALMWSQNYGNALTNYALYTHLEKEGYKVLALDNYSPLRPVGIMGKFAKDTYKLSSAYFRDNDKELLNETCDCFIVGSDQNWNFPYQQYWKYGDYFYLDFVTNDKKKLSFGTSFGQPSAAMPAERGTPLFKRFDAISVREEFGVPLCQEMYGVEAKKVVDPVFLLDRKEYEALAMRSELREEEPFIMTYILNPTKEKRKLCLEIQKQLGGIKLVNILDCNPGNEDYNRIMMEFDNVKCRIPLEDWVYYMQHCRYVVTDSFHGTCFSIIFGKPFVTVRNRERYRFETFEKYEALAGRIIDGNSEWHMDEWMEDIDYDSMQEGLNKEIEESKEFLRIHMGKN